MFDYGVRVMVFNTTFNNISVIYWRSVLLLEETEVPGENHPPDASHWQTVSHKVVSSTHRLSGIQTHNFNGDILKKKKPPLQYTYDYILEKIVRRFNCTLLFRLYDVLYVIILLYSILYWCILQLKNKKQKKKKKKKKLQWW